MGSISKKYFEISAFRNRAAVTEVPYSHVGYWVRHALIGHRWLQHLGAKTEAKRRKKYGRSDPPGNKRLSTRNLPKNSLYTVLCFSLAMLKILKQKEEQKTIQTKTTKTIFKVVILKLDTIIFSNKLCLVGKN